MHLKLRSFVAGSALLLSAAQPLPAAPVTLTIQADQPGARINPAMWGIFFEDINFGADGGLYAELVKNRSFEFPNPLLGWKKLDSAANGGKAEIKDEQPFDPANPHYLRVQAEGAAPFGMVNEGFRGMGIAQGEDYDFSAQVRVSAGNPSVTVELVGADGKTLARTALSKGSSQWQKLSATLTAKATDAKAHLNLLVEGAGTVDFDMVSLFPRKTWKNRPGGLRADMVQRLAELKPGFLRFPGGCIVEGSELSGRYQWKTTVGPVADRKLIVNRWNSEFKHRLAPDYFQSFGLGFFEFFQLCEDIGAEPLPILNCGMACQFNSGQLVALEQLEPYIQDALDLLEFANGPTSSPWGARRAAMGHPAPFNLKLLGVGNEQWGPQYIERYAAFAKAIKAKYPNIQLISAAGPSPADDRFQFLWPKLRALNADIIDEHCYANPVWFLSNADRYDHYDRRGPKVFMGEYAAQSVAIASPNNRNNLECALAEAAYMTGLERNADVVRMASYAPLFANAGAWQWTPDLIWADNLRVYSTPNYYVQQLFSLNRGDVVLPVANNAPVTTVPPAGRIGLGTYHTAAEFKEVRVTRGSEVLLASDFTTAANGWSGGRSWSVKEGAYRQTDAKASASTFAGEPSWSNYTLALKARKLSGAEGFLITVRSAGPEDYVVWNVGGWGNQFHGLQSHFAQQDQLVTRTPGSIQANRWYDLKVELKGAHLNCYVDGQLVHSVDIPARRTPTLFASASREEKTGQIILKVVNPAGQPTAAAIQLRGLTAVAPAAQATILSSRLLGDENSFEQPAKVVPVTVPVTGVKPEFDYTFQPWSLTVLRLGASAPLPR